MLGLRAAGIAAMIGWLVLAAPGRASGPPVNTICPVQTEEKADPKITTVYEGRTIAFCCRMCRRDFLADPQKYVANLPAAAGALAHGEDEPGGEGHEHEGDAREGPEEGVGHSHEGGEGSAGWIEVAGRFHPLVVHFPIALVVVGALAEWLSLLGAAPWGSRGARFFLYLGALGAVAAAGLGWAAAARHSFPGSIATTVTWHRWVGTGAAAASLGAVLLLEVYRRRSDPRGRLGYRLLLAAAAVGVAVAGHLGATLVYGPGYLLGGAG